jgi:DNA-binding NtrC family response regulator
MKKILIVEDEDIIRQALKRLLENNQYEVSEAASVKEAKAQALESFDLVISDLRLPGEPGTDMIKLAGNTPVLIMTSYASLRTAVDSMKMGAVDYIAKPFDHDEMLNAVARITRENAIDHDIKATPNTTGQLQAPNIIGSSRAMEKVFRQIEKSAPTDCNILIHGETGTGKELIAQAVHQNSQRKNQAIISVNCAAIPETLIESELFGYEKGAFTGANADREGLIEAADQGTLFLDEIGELPLEAQARLLRFLQEGEIRRIGSVKSTQVDVRVIAATHRDLKKLAQHGEFRQDLFYRLDVMHIMLPPLRERGKDILSIAEAFLEKTANKMAKSTMHFTPTAVQALTTYQWPGNIRELENVIERAVILSDSDSINDDDLDIDLELIELDQIADEEKQAIKSPRSAFIDSDQEGLSLEDYFQRFILEHQDQMSETELARKLGVSRKSLWERRKRLGIPRKGK